MSWRLLATTGIISARSSRLGLPTTPTSALKIKFFYVLYNNLDNSVERLFLGTFVRALKWNVTPLIRRGSNFFSLQHFIAPALDLFQEKTLFNKFWLLLNLRATIFCYLPTRFACRGIKCYCALLQDLGSENKTCLLTPFIINKKLSNVYMSTFIYHTDSLTST